MEQPPPAPAALVSPAFFFARNTAANLCMESYFTREALQHPVTEWSEKGGSLRSSCHFLNGLLEDSKGVRFSFPFFFFPFSFFLRRAGRADVRGEHPQRTGTRIHARMLCVYVYVHVCVCARVRVRADAIERRGYKTGYCIKHRPRKTRRRHSN